MSESTITIDGILYSLVRAQRDGESAVYTSENTFLRIGVNERIRRDLNLHREMEKYTFPLAKILSEGTYQGKSYYIEKSLGKDHFGAIFKSDMEKSGIISDVHFKEFLSLVSRIATAQLNTKKSEGNIESFANGIKLSWICDELPEYADVLRSRFDASIKKVSEFPFVLSHGDCNPHNLYPVGMIDLEDSFYGPFGYDLITAIVHTDYMPTGDQYEHVAGYRYTATQKQEYLSTIDNISVKAKLPKLSDYFHDFEFFRAVWLAVRMHKTPHLQKFRYDKLISKFLLYNC